LEKRLVQILMVVANSKMRSFTTEVDNGFRWSVFRSELVDPKRFVKYDKKCEKLGSGQLGSVKFFVELKGKNVNIHLLDMIAWGGNSLRYSEIFKTFWWQKWTWKPEEEDECEDIFFV